MNTCTILHGLCFYWAYMFLDGLVWRTLSSRICLMKPQYDMISFRIRLRILRKGFLFFQIFQASLIG
ncbi:hypothetical protein BDV28DRAFT_141661 [Aspergillus coremiiformis]|uniref:Uncharacterized protein n=1 Tax=Aspergillus coremiiformis TaxID=138285 RepID=A0A5N6YX41_9EURO|nr:hypothetical protein BDV28DRAFT_141661 [Aspergillus coremiiformis]